MFEMQNIVQMMQIKDIFTKPILWIGLILLEQNDADDTDDADDADDAHDAADANDVADDDADDGDDDDDDPGLVKHSAARGVDWVKLQG